MRRRIRYMPLSYRLPTRQSNQRGLHLLFVNFQEFPQLLCSAIWRAKHRKQCWPWEEAVSNVWLTSVLQMAGESYVEHCWQMQAKVYSELLYLSSRLI